jgi:protein TonB
VELVMSGPDPLAGHVAEAPALPDLPQAHPLPPVPETEEPADLPPLPATYAPLPLPEVPLEEEAARLPDLAPPPRAARPPPRPSPPARSPARASMTAPLRDTVSAAPGTARGAADQGIAAQPDAGPPIVTNPRFRAPPAPPVYPPRAIEMALTGTAVIRALVGPDGATQEIRLWRSSGTTLLDQAALAAVRRWSFEPARSAGAPIAAWVEVPVRFQMQ